MLFKKVLVPYDESDHAKSALHVAFGMVGDDPEAEVHVVTAVSVGALPDPLFGSGSPEDPFSVASQVDYDNLLGALLQRTRDDMAGVIDDALDGAECKVVTNAIVASSAVEGIADYVENHDIDLVVMGRRGLGRLSGMIGSVSFGVLRSVNVPVMTVK